MAEHLEGEMGMPPTYADPSFYFYHENSRKTIGLTGVYVDYSFYSSTLESINHSKKTLCNLKS